MAIITVGTNSWVTEAEADSYMESRIGAEDYWDDGDVKNHASLITAYKELNNTNKFTFPTTATAIMKDAQCEYALYLLIHEPDRSIREGLQTQAVVEAGIVKEKYNRAGTTVHFPPLIESMLADYKTEKPFFIFDVERDEEQETDYDAVTNLDRDV